MALMSKDLPKGELFEARVARLLTAEGGFARRRVNLEAQFGERFRTITDVDVLSYSFAGDLAAHVTVTECKTTEAKGQPGTGDRLLWLAGLRTLVNADRAVLATHKNADGALREIAARLGCEILDPADLAHREAILGLREDGDYWAHDPRLAAFDRATFDLARRDDELKRLYWFARSEVWLAPPPVGVKRGLGALRLLGGRWSERLPDRERVAVEWLVAQVSVGVVLSIVRFASIAYRQPEAEFQRYLLERLAEGVADYRALQEIARQVDKYVVGVLAGAGVEASVSTGAIGAFSPQPPAYIEPLSEVIARLTGEPLGARELPQVADALFAQRFLASMSIGATTAESSPQVARLLRIIAAFLERQAKVPPALIAPLRGEATRSTPLPDGASHGSAKVLTSPSRSLGSSTRTAAKAEVVPMFPSEAAESPDQDLEG